MKSISVWSYLGRTDKTMDLIHAAENFQSIGIDRDLIEVRIGTAKLTNGRVTDLTALSVTTHLLMSITIIV